MARTLIARKSGLAPAIVTAALMMPGACGPASGNEDAAPVETRAEAQDQAQVSSDEQPAASIGNRASYASAPSPSPETSGAAWRSDGSTARIVYGVADNDPLIALECVDGAGENAGARMVRITRFASADGGAGAMMALIGNGHVRRIPIDATTQEGAAGATPAWQGTYPADSEFWDPIAAGGSATATVPGAGKITLGGSSIPAALIARCRTS